MLRLSPVVIAFAACIPSTPAPARPSSGSASAGQPTAVAFDAQDVRTWPIDDVWHGKATGRDRAMAVHVPSDELRESTGATERESDTDEGEEEDAGSGCGKERTEVKDGFDVAVGEVELEHAKRGDIAQLGALKAPAKIAMHMPRTGDVERTVFTLRNVHLTYAKHEADGDYHFAIEHDGAKMIVEVPDPMCGQRGGSAVLDQLRAARAKVDAELTVTKHGADQDKVVTVVGIGFYDKVHGGKNGAGQIGHAPNAIELHPVLAICFGQDCKLEE